MSDGSSCEDSPDEAQQNLTLKASRLPIPRNRLRTWWPKKKTTKRIPIMPGVRRLKTSLEVPGEDITIGDMQRGSEISLVADCECRTPELNAPLRRCSSEPKMTLSAQECPAFFKSHFSFGQDKTTADLPISEKAVSKERHLLPTSRGCKCDRKKRARSECRGVAWWSHIKVESDDEKEKDSQELDKPYINISEEDHYAIITGRAEMFIDSVTGEAVLKFNDDQ